MALFSQEEKRRRKTPCSHCEVWSMLTSTVAKIDATKSSQSSKMIAVVKDVMKVAKNVEQRRREVVEEENKRMKERIATLEARLAKCE